MKKLSQAQIRERAEFARRLETAHTELQAAVGTANKALEDLQGALSEYDSVVGELEDWRTDIHAAMEEFVEDRPDGWTDTENGMAYIAWMSLWEEGFPEAELDVPSEVEMPDCMDGSSLEDLSEEP